MLLNLCVNARDAMPDGGTLTVEATRRQISAIEAHAFGEECVPGEYVQWRIRDTGLGIPKDLVERIFEPFYSTKSPEKGTGLGLSTTIGIVRSHGGFMRVHSRPSEGSTFSVYWPLASTATTESAPAAPLQRARTSSGEHVLLVEDEDQVRNFMIKGLEHEGFAVTACPSADCALEKLAKSAIRPDILVTDVVMPRVNGGQLAEAVRQRYPGLPVLFVSGYTDDIIAQHGIVRDGVALLEKPFSPSVLARKVRELIDARGKLP